MQGFLEGKYDDLLRQMCYSEDCNDELLQNARAIVVQENRCTRSLLKAKLKIGDAEAVRLIDSLVRERTILRDIENRKWEVIEDGKGYLTQQDIYELAKRMVINSKIASASFIQKRLKIGYAHAARLLDTLEENGIVGPQIGSKPRKVLVSNNEQGD